MPWKDKSKRHAYQRKWHADRRKNDPVWYAKKLASKNAYRSSGDVRVRATRLIERSHQNDHRYKMREWESERGKKENQQFAEAGLNIVSDYWFRNPKFTVIDKHGNHRTEFLNSPLPSWDADDDY